MKSIGARMFAAAVVLAALVVSPGTHAQTAFPDRPVKLVNPFPPGAVSDAMLRGMADWLSKKWNQPVLVENKPGAGGLIAGDYVAKSAPDGHTIGLVLPGIAISAAARSSMPFDPLKDFAPVTQLASIPLGLFAHPATPFQTVPELIRHAKANPGKLSFASVGAGSGSHMAGELFKVLAGVDLVHVPYKGSAPAQLDLIAGRIDLFFDAVAPEVEYLKAGKVKMLGVATKDPLPAYPGHAPIGASVPGYVVDSWFGMVVPAGTPARLIERLNADLIDAVRSKEVFQLLESRGMTVVGSSPAAFSAVLKQEVAKWVKVVKTTGIRID